MKYMITWELKEPVMESYKKGMEIEKGRMNKGEVFTQDEIVLGTHIITSEGKGVQIVDTDYSRLAKWGFAYMPVYKFKISPLMSREEFEKVIQ